jgi:hypothetical protein
MLSRGGREFADEWAGTSHSSRDSDYLRGCLKSPLERCRGGEANKDTVRAAIRFAVLIVPQGKVMTDVYILGIDSEASVLGIASEAVGACPSIHRQGPLSPFQTIVGRASC